MRRPLSLKRNKRAISRVKVKRMIPSRWRQKNSHENIVPNMGMMKIIVGNFIQR